MNAEITRKIIKDNNHQESHLRIKRCPECPRPICQRLLSVDDVCKDMKKAVQKPIQDIPREIIEKYSVNEPKMHDLFSGA